jgi:hypothetical protein
MNGRLRNADQPYIQYPTMHKLQTSQSGRARFRRVKLGIVLFALYGCPNAAEFNIEDEALVALPAEALASVRAHVATTDYNECAPGQFIGMAMDLSGTGRSGDWIAKTADGCGWGAASAKIWVLHRDGKSFRVVLDSGGQVLSLRKTRSHGLRDAVIESITAGHYAETVFTFNGKKYTQSSSRAVNLQDPAECKKNSDVCRGT